MSTGSSYPIPFASDSSPGLHIRAVAGGTQTHLYRIDTGSVGMIVPRSVLGTGYPKDPMKPESEFQYVSDGRTYLGQWVNVPVTFGVPIGWDGSGDYPTTQIDVFAVDSIVGSSDVFTGGMLGIGFGINNKADGGPCRNPFLHLNYQGVSLSAGYIIRSSEIEVGLTDDNTREFEFIALTKGSCDWMQPEARVSVSGTEATMPFLMDTGIDYMILWLSDSSLAGGVLAGEPFPAGTEISVAVPDSAPVFSYSFKTDDASDAMAPSEVIWKSGNGINTGANVLAGAEYLYDYVLGRIGFHVLTE